LIHQMTGNGERPKLSDRIGHRRNQPGGATIRPDGSRNRHVLVHAKGHAMRYPLLDVHGIQPEPGAVLRGSRVDQRAIVEQRRMADFGVVARHALRLAAVGSNPPHIQFVWWKAAHKIYVTAIRGPDVMMTVYPGFLHENLFPIGAVAVTNEGRVSGHELVIDDPLAVRRPRHVDRSFEKRPRRSAYRGHEPDIVAVLAGRICMAEPQPNM